jgi:hypothetical protein
MSKKQLIKNFTVTYVGDGGFITGVPMRDMSQEEWLALPDELLALALASGLYEVHEIEELQDGEVQS